MTRKQRLAEVERLIKAHDLDDALRLVDALLAENRDRDALLQRARVGRLLGDQDAARAIIEEAKNRGISDDDFVEELAQVEFFQGLKQPALAIAEDILTRRPGSEPALRIAAAVREIDDQYDEAERLIAKALQLHPTCASALAVSATIDAAPRNPKRAQLLAAAWDRLQEALRLDPRDEWALQALPQLFATTRGDEVESFFTKQLNNLANDPNLLARYAQFHFLRGNFGEAARFAKGAAVIRPKWAVPKLLEVMSLKESGKRDAALTAADELCKAFPNDVRFKSRYLELARDAGNFALAMKLLEEITAIVGSESSDVVISRIDLLRRAGAIDEARKLCASWRTRSKDFSDLQQVIAFTYSVTGSPSMALAFLDECGARNEAVLAMRVLILVTHGDFAEADRVADEALQAFSEGADLLTLKAWLLGNSGKFGEAEEVLANAKSLGPLNEQNAAVGVELKLMQGDFAAAAAVATTELERLPDSIDLRLDLAQAQYALGEYDKAINLLDEAIVRDRSLTMPIQMKAITLHRQGKIYDAVLLLESALVLHSRSSGLHACLGYIRFHSDDNPSLAEAEFRKALNAGAGGPIARAGLGAVAYRHRNYRDAEMWFREVTNLQPFSLDAQTNVAWTLAAAGERHQLSEAERICKGILANRPNHAGALGCLGAVAHRREERRNAEWLFETASKKAPEDVDMCVNLGAAQARTGKYKEAEETLRKALEADSANARALIELARLMLKESRFDDARRFAQAAVDANPHIAASWRVLAATASAENRDSYAEEVLRRGIAQADDPERDDLRLELARLLLKLAEPKPSDPRLREALEHLALVLEVHPEAAEALLLRGLVELRAERPGAALKFFDRVKDPRLQGYVAGMRQAAFEMRDTIQQRIGPVEQYTLAAIVALELVTVWIAFFVHRGKEPLLSPAAFATLVPITTALLMVAMLLPRLSSLKVATLEATLVLPPRDVQTQALVGPAADIDMTPALEPLVMGGFLAFDP